MQSYFAVRGRFRPGPAFLRAVLGALVAAAVLVAPGVAFGGQEPVSAPPESLERILADLASWDGGVESGARWRLRDHVRAHGDDAKAREGVEDALVSYLAGRASFQARMEAARHLRLIAGERSVAPLQKLLRDPASADLAIYVLQQVPGAAAERALTEELSAAVRRGSPPSILTARGLIAALGQRRSTAAVPALAPLLGHRDLAAPAAAALGRIGDDAAREALAAALAGAQAQLRPALAAALLACAERAIGAGDASAASRLYDTLASDASLPGPVRQASLLGRIDAAGANAPRVLMEMLSAVEPGPQEAAIARVREVVPPERIAPVCELLPRLPVPSQEQLLAVLATYPGERVRSCVAEAARGGQDSVRAAALRALGSVGDASNVKFLAETAARARGAEQTAARTALGSLKGRAVDEAIVSALEAAPAEDLGFELLLAVADRRIFAAKPVVAASLASASPRGRVQALKTLRTIGTPSDVPALLDLIVAETDDGVRHEAGLTAAALAGKVASPDRRAAAVRARLRSETSPEARARVLAVLPLIGDASTLPDLRAALADGSAEVVDAAVRALAAWPTPAAREDVLSLAAEARNETHRLLAIRGLVRLVAMDRYRLPAAAIADLRAAASFAWRPEEHKLVLGALTQFPCAGAVELAKSFLQEAEVQAEAQAAIEKINAQLAKGAI